MPFIQSREIPTTVFFGGGPVGNEFLRYLIELNNSSQIKLDGVYPANHLGDGTQPIVDLCHE